MKITGVTYHMGDRIWSELKSDPTDSLPLKNRKNGMLKFLQYLKTIDGPELWIRNYSWGILDLCAHDSQDEWDRVPVLASVETFGPEPYAYRIKYPLPIEVLPWMSKGHLNQQEPQDFSNSYDPVFYEQLDWWGCATASGVEEGAYYLLSAIENSNANPNRIRSDWMWYVCPNCDFHSPRYKPHCEGCKYAFPPQKQMEAIGMYRKVRVPTGSVAPTESQADTTQ
ncbi:MAG: hypothetical protein KDA77_06360 [Planctomycetaceae bacterium]|nr:hypothetical protein [Planctomycetaceae bacterium]